MKRNLMITALVMSVIFATSCAFDTTSVSSGTSLSVYTETSTETSVSAEVSSEVSIEASIETPASVQAEEEPEEELPEGAVKVTIPESELGESLYYFRSTNLDGEEVTADVFHDYDITVVHVWGTFCGPCIREMGEYASFYKNKPTNVNLIAILCDVYEGYEDNVDYAKEILADNSAEFVNLKTSVEILDIVDAFDYVPSSFLVDKEGRIIGEMMDGVSFENTYDRLCEYIEQESHED